MVEFIVLISLIMSLVALSIDAMLPALNQIGEDLAVENSNDLQYIIAVLFLGMGFGQMLFGPLSDSIGRKPAISIGFGIFLLGCLLSAFAQNFETMLIGRLLQGFGASSPRIVTVALVRDSYSGRAMARVMSFSMSIFILVPIMAPALGQWVMGFAGWRGIFISFIGLTAIVSIWFLFRLRETLPVNRRRRFSFGELAYNLRSIVTNRIICGYTVTAGFVFGAFVAYLSLSQKIFQDQYQLGDDFPLYFGVLASSIGAASLLNASLVMRLGMRLLSIVAMACSLLVSVLFLIFSHVHQGHPPLVWLMIYLLSLFFFTGILFGNLNALAMEPLKKFAGLGAAFIGSLSTLLSAAFGVVIADAYDGTVLPLIIGFSLFSLLGLLTIIWLRYFVEPAEL